MDRYNIQTGTRVFKMDREKLQQNPIPSYLYFGKYKFRIRYQGQSTTCGYCAENDHLERDCPKKANMKILVKKSKMQRRVAAIPNDSESEMEKEIQPTHEEAAKSFERGDSTIKKEEQKKEATVANAPFQILVIHHHQSSRRKKQILQLKKTSVNCLNPTQKLTAVAARKIKI